jgi:hypothetical protein
MDFDDTLIWLRQGSGAPGVSAMAGTWFETRRRLATALSIFIIYRA